MFVYADIINLVYKHEKEPEPTGDSGVCVLACSLVQEFVTGHQWSDDPAKPGATSDWVTASTGRPARHVIPRPEIRTALFLSSPLNFRSHEGWASRMGLEELSPAKDVLLARRIRSTATETHPHEMTAGTPGVCMNNPNGTYRKP